ncbi:hypothetical protein, partial [Myxococcus sp. CA039A]
VYQRFFENFNSDYLEEHVSLDDALSAKAMEDHAKRAIPGQLAAAQEEVKRALHSVRIRSAWRVEGTLREYPKFEPVNMWFQYPIHRVDDVGSLKDLQPPGETEPWKKAIEKRKESAQKERRSKEAQFEDAVNNCNFGEPPTVKDVVEWFGKSGKEVSERTIRDWIKRYGYVLQDGVIIKDSGDDHD